MYSFVLHQSQCTNNCVFCRSREFGNIEKNIEEEFQKFQNLIDKGEKITAVEISGNDPGEYSELPEVIKKIKELCSPNQIVLTTHGKTLNNESFVQDLIDAGVTHFTIALYGHNAETHDAVTECLGSFQQTFDALICLHNIGAEVNITSLIMKENQDSIADMFSLFSTITKQVIVGVPCYVKGSRFKKSIPDFRKLKKDLSEVLKKVQIFPFNLILKDIPYCMLEIPYEKMIASSLPDEGYEHWREEEKLKSGFVEEREGKIIPQYRMMEKQKQCKQCKYFKKCPGFYKTYLDEGLFELKAIT